MIYFKVVFNFRTHRDVVMLLKNPRLKFFFCFFVLVISSSSLSVDTDLDGLSDVWELANNRDPLVSDYQIEVS